MNAIDNKRQTWTCRIGVTGEVEIPDGADYPMRVAVGKAFLAVTGREAEHCFSGWGDKWSELEVAVIEDRLPKGDDPQEPRDRGCDDCTTAERAAFLWETVRGAVATLESGWGISGRDDEWIYDEIGSQLSSAYFALRSAIKPPR